MTERDGLVYDMPDAEYHGGPELSSSAMKTLLDSPARYRWEREHRVEKSAYDLGHVVHTIVLGTGLKPVVVEADSWRTAAAREKRDEARAGGGVPMLAHEWAQAKAMAGAVLAHPDARAVLEAPGQSEASAFWSDPETGVRLRARFDRLANRHFIADLKTGQTADPRLWARKAVEFNYDLQAAVYRQGLTATRGDEDPIFWHILVESAAPHLVSVVQLSPDFLAIGEQKARVAIDLYHHCTQTGEWPGFPTGVHPVEPPGWHQSPLLEDYL